MSLRLLAQQIPIVGGGQIVQQGDGVGKGRPRLSRGKKLRIVFQRVKPGSEGRLGDAQV